VRSDLRTRVGDYTAKTHEDFAAPRDFAELDPLVEWHKACSNAHLAMNDREAKSRAVKILAKSIYRDLEAQGFDEKQIVALATELISEVTNKISREHVKSQLA
jgi:hypothetical protein